MLKMGNGHEKQADSEGGKTKMNRIEDEIGRAHV